MKPFDRSPKCEKCTSLDISRQYHAPDFDPCWRCGPWESPLSGSKNEHFYMHCRGCGFKWQQMIAPVKKPILDIADRIEKARRLTPIVGEE